MQSLRKKLNKNIIIIILRAFCWLSNNRNKNKKTKKQLISIKVLKTIYGSLCARISQICGKKTA